MDKPVDVSVGVSVGVMSVGVAVGASVKVSVGDRGVAVGSSLEDCRGDCRGPCRGNCHGQCHGPLGVPLLPAHSVEARGMSVKAARGRSAVAGGVSVVVRGTPWTWPWNAVEVRGHCGGAPPKRQIMCIPLFPRHQHPYLQVVVVSVCRRYCDRGCHLMEQVPVSGKY